MSSDPLGCCEETRSHIDFERALVSLDRAAAQRVLGSFCGTEGLSLATDHLIAPVMENIGRLWDEGHLSLSQVYMAGRLCEELITLDTAHNPPSESITVATVVLSDYHYLEKRLVDASLRAAGFAPIDYGRMDLQPLVDRVLKERPSVLMVSALMLPSALMVLSLTTQLREAKCSTKVIVGGAPFRLDPELWKFVKADAMGRVASDASALAREMQ